MSFEPGLAVGDRVSFFVNLESMNRKDGDDAKDISGKSLNPPYGPAEGVIIQLIEGDIKVIVISINEANYRKAKLQEYYFNNTAHIVAHMIGDAQIPPTKIFYKPRAHFAEVPPYEIVITEVLPNPEGKRIVTKITTSAADPNPFATGSSSSSSAAAGGGGKPRRTRRNKRRSTRRGRRFVRR